MNYQHWGYLIFAEDVKDIEWMLDVELQEQPIWIFDKGEENFKKERYNFLLAITEGEWDEKIEALRNSIKALKFQN